MSDVESLAVELMRLERVAVELDEDRIIATRAEANQPDDTVSMADVTESIPGSFVIRSVAADFASGQLELVIGPRGGV